MVIVIETNLLMLFVCLYGEETLPIQTFYRLPVVQTLLVATKKHLFYMHIQLVSQSKVEVTIVHEHIRLYVSTVKRHFQSKHFTSCQ